MGNSNGVSRGSYVGLHLLFFMLTNVQVREQIVMMICGRTTTGSIYSSALLYVNKRSSEGTNRYDDLWSYDDWVALFTDISNGDDIFTVNDFIPFWTGGANPYGGEAQARAVFDIFDLERSFFINRLEWDALFVLFDWDGDEMLGVEEMLTIDYYLNEGAGLRLGDKSFVGTKEGHINRMLDSKRN